MYAEVTQSLYLRSAEEAETGLLGKKFRVNLVAALGMLQGGRSLTEIDNKLDASGFSSKLKPAEMNVDMGSMETVDSLHTGPGSTDSQPMKRDSYSSDEDSLASYSLPRNQRKMMMTHQLCLHQDTSQNLWKNVLLQSANQSYEE